MPYNYKYDISKYNQRLSGDRVTMTALSDFLEKIYIETNYFTRLARYDIMDFKPPKDGTLFKFRSLIGFVIGLLVAKLLINLCILLDIFTPKSTDDFEVLVLISTAVLFSFSFLLFFRSTLHQDRKILFTYYNIIQR